MLFLPALSAACGLEAQEEIFPGNKFRYTELRLEGTLPVSGYPTPLYLFRRAARTQDGYVFDRSYTSVADGETLKLPLAELKAYDYRFLMVAQPGDAQWLSLSTATGTQFVPGVAWEDLRLGCASGAAAPDGYSGYTDLSGEAILLDGKIRLTLTRVAGQVLFDIYRTGSSLSQPESILSPDVESVIDRIARIEISYENPTTELRFDENGTLVPAAYASEPLVQSILPQMTDFKVPLPQTDKGLGIYDDGVRGSLRMKGAFLLPSDSKLRVKLLFTYYDTTPACGNGHTGVHSAACFPQRQLRARAAGSFTLGTFCTLPGERTSWRLRLYGEDDAPLYDRVVTDTLRIECNQLIDLTARFEEGDFRGEIEFSVDVDTTWDGANEGGGEIIR